MLKKNKKPIPDKTPDFSDSEKKFIETLKPIIDEAITIKVEKASEPIRHELDSMKKTFLEEFKNLQKNLKQAPPTAQGGGMNAQTNNLLNELKKDPQLGPLINQFTGGAQPGAPGAAPATPPMGGMGMMMLPPNYKDLDNDQKMMVWQQMNGQMLLMNLLPVVAPMLAGQNEASQQMMQILQRQWFDNISYNSHLNRGLMQYLVKKGVVDEGTANSYQASSLNYLSPITDPHLYNPNMPQNPQQIQQQVAQAQQQQQQPTEDKK